jgi:hypothetical protein
LCRKIIIWLIWKQGSKSSFKHDFWGVIHFHGDILVEYQAQDQDSLKTFYCDGLASLPQPILRVRFRTKLEGGRSSASRNSRFSVRTQHDRLPSGCVWRMARVTQC